MKKDAYYFKHDSNAKDDPKCILLIEEMGPEGYGIFWILLEILRDQPNYRYPVNLIPSIARKNNSTIEKIKQVIAKYGLFDIQDGDFFSSPSFSRRMDEINQTRIELSVAGKRGRQKQIEAKRLQESFRIETGHPQATPGQGLGNKSEHIISDQNKTNQTNLPPAVSSLDFSSPSNGHTPQGLKKNNESADGKKVAGHPCATMEEYLALDKTCKKPGMPPIKPGKDMPEMTWRSPAWFFNRIVCECAQVREFPFLDEAWQQWAFEELGMKDVTYPEMLKQTRYAIDKKVAKTEKEWARQ